MRRQLSLSISAPAIWSLGRILIWLETSTKTLLLIESVKPKIFLRDPLTSLSIEIILALPKVPYSWMREKLRPKWLGDSTSTTQLLTRQQNPFSYCCLRALEDSRTKLIHLIPSLLLMQLTLLTQITPAVILKMETLFKSRRNLTMPHKLSDFTQVNNH